MDNLDRLSGRFEKLQISNQDITSYELFFAELYLEEAEIIANRENKMLLIAANKLRFPVPNLIFLLRLIKRTSTL